MEGICSYYYRIFLALIRCKLPQGTIILELFHPQFAAVCSTLTYDITSTHSEYQVVLFSFSKRSTQKYTAHHGFFVVITSCINNPVARTFYFFSHYFLSIVLVPSFSPCMFTNMAFFGNRTLRLLRN